MAVITNSNSVFFKETSNPYDPYKKLINSIYGIQSLSFENDTRSHYKYLTDCGHYRRVTKIKDVKFNDPATIVFWDDGTKTVVKCKDEEFDPEKGLAMAIAKKFMGTNESKSNYCDIFKKYIGKYEKQEN